MRGGAQVQFSGPKRKLGSLTLMDRSHIIQTCSIKKGLTSDDYNDVE